MDSTHGSETDYWGTLINAADKSPSPLLVQLCLGIAQWMTSFDSLATSDLTPERLAHFYQKTGGDYDALFLQTNPASLSFIYQSLGCFHSLQPTTNAFEPPSIPALLPLGFVRWQTIQLLLDPDEHYRYLQSAVTQRDIANPGGGSFPRTLPRSAFPSEPDPEMVEWHEKISRRLEYDYWKRNTPLESPLATEPRPSHSSGSCRPPEDPDYFCHTHHSGSIHRPNDPEIANPRVAHQNRQRRRSAESPSVRLRRPDSKPDPIQPQEFRNSTRYPAPKAPSPPLWSERDARRQGSIHLSAGARTVHERRASAFNVSDASSEDSDTMNGKHPGFEERKHHRRNLSPPHPRQRSRSHDASYLGRPRRDRSPGGSRRPRPDIVDADGSLSTRWRNYESLRHSDGHHSRGAEMLPQKRPSRSASVRFREHIFRNPSVPDYRPERPSGLAPSPHHRSAPDGYFSQMRSHLDPLPKNEFRRGSHGGISGSGSGSSGSERMRSHSSAGIHALAPRWASPARSSGAKRYTPPGLATDDGEHLSRSGRRFVV